MSEKDSSEQRSFWNTSGWKVCKKCGKRKRLSAFYKIHSEGERLAAHCKTCVKKNSKDRRKQGYWKSYYSRPEIKERERDQAFQRQFGISLAEYKELEKKQNGLCAVCQLPETWKDHRTGKVKTLSVDHDHKTGKVRGLLCYSCNLGIGSFKDDPTRMQRAIDYLNRNGL